MQWKSVLTFARFAPSQSRGAGLLCRAFPVSGFLGNGGFDDARDGRGRDGRDGRDAGTAGREKAKAPGAAVGKLASKRSSRRPILRGTRLWWPWPEPLQRSVADPSQPALVLAPSRRGPTPSISCPRSSPGRPEGGSVFFFLAPPNTRGVSFLGVVYRLTSSCCGMWFEVESFLMTWHLLKSQCSTSHALLQYLSLRVKTSSSARALSLSLLSEAQASSAAVTT